jgi:hypothetical protein
MKGNVTMTGYWPDSPDRNNDFNVIPSNNITMKRMKQPLVGISNTGDTRIMNPGEEHQFDGNYVLEMPLNKMNGKITDPTVIQRLIDNHKQMRMRNGGSLRTYQGDTDPSTVQTDPPMLPITGVPYAFQTPVVGAPDQWMSLPDFSKSNTYRADLNNANHNEAFTGYMNYNPDEFNRENGNISSSFPMNNIAYEMPQIHAVGAPNRGTKYAKEFMTQNPDPNNWEDGRDPNSPVTEKFFGGLLGIGKTATNPYTGEGWSYNNRQTNYQNAKTDYMAMKLLGENPQGDRSRQEWLASFTPGELATLQQSKKFSGEVAPNMWAKGAQGLLSSAATGVLSPGGMGLRAALPESMRPQVPNLFPGQLSEEEAKDAGILDALGMMTIPAQGVKGMITEGSGRGWAGASPIDYTGGRDAVLDTAGDIIIDPMNLVGVGIGKQAVKGVRAVKPFIQAGTEMGAAGTQQLMSRIVNPALEKNAGLLAQSVPGEARLGFGPNSYINQLDSEAARFGSLEYQGKTGIDKYKAFSETNLPLPEVQTLAEAHGVQNARNMTKDEIAQAFKAEAVNSEYVKSLDQTQKIALENEVFQNVTGEGLDEFLINNPYYSNRNEALRLYDIPDAINKGRTDVVQAMDKLFPNRSLTDIENGIDAAAGISKNPGSTITKPMDQLQTPEGFIGSNTTTGSSKSQTNFPGLLGDPAKGSGVAQQIIETGAQSNKPYTQIVEDLAAAYSKELYGKGYTKKQIEQMTSSFKELTNKSAMDYAESIATTGNGQSLSSRGINSVEDLVGTPEEQILTHFLSNEVHPTLNSTRNSPDIFTKVEAVGSVKPTGKDIAKAAVNLNPYFGQTPHDLAAAITAIDQQLAQVPKAERAALAQEIMADVAAGNHYHASHLANGYIDDLSKLPADQKSKPLADFYSKAYKGLLGKGETQTLKDIYTEFYNVRYDNAIRQGMDPVDAHNIAFRQSKRNPEDLLSYLGQNEIALLEQRGIEAADIQKLREGLGKVTTEKMLKPGILDTFSQISQQGRAAGRGNKFVLPETKEALAGQVKLGKENLVNLNKPKSASFTPSTEVGYKGYVDELTRSLFANQFKNSREMAISVKNSLETGMNNAKVGQVLTGATNTSKDSYLIQMDFLMRIHAANPTATKPVFLGFEPMNSYAFATKYKLLDKEQTLHLINNKLNDTQKATNVNFGFEDKFPHIDVHGRLMIPQWGLEKTENVPIKIKKKKYGGEVGYGERPFMGYIPFDYTKAYGL